MAERRRAAVSGTPRRRDRIGAALRIILLLTLLATGGCSPMTPEDFAGTEPRFLPEEFFAGQTRGHGFFQDRFGRIRREFRVDIEGRVEGDTLVLEEEFHYQDGEREQRRWTIRRVAPGRYEGEAADLVGTATGVAVGRAANWRYTFTLPVGGGRWSFAVDDWMLLQDDRTMLNRSTFRKFGLKVGEVVILFTKTATRASRASAAAEGALLAAAE
jgi:hypothetical protein